MSLFNKLESKLKTVFKNDSMNSEIVQVVEKIYEETKVSNDTYGDQLKIAHSSTYQVIKAKTAREKVDILFKLIELLKPSEQNKAWKKWQGNPVVYRKLLVAETLSNLLLRQKLDFEDAEYISLFDTFFKTKKIVHYWNWPVGIAFTQVEKHVAKNGLNDTLKQYLLALVESKKLDEKVYYGPDLKKIKIKITKLIGESSGEVFIPSFKLSETDELGQFINESISKISEAEQKHWYQIFHLAVVVSGGKPKQKYLKAVKPHVDALGKKFKPLVWQWFERFATLKEKEQTNTHTYDNGRTYTWTSYNFLEEKNAVLLKGLVWSLVHFHDKKTLDLLARVTERAFKKIPGVGPAAAAIGNAAIYVLAQSKGLVGVSHLSRLKLKIQQNNTRKLIQKYVTEQSEKLGISAAEIEDLAVPDYGLTGGKKVLNFEDYQFTIEITGIGKMKTQWLKPDGKTQKSVPAFVKQNKKHSDKLKAAKAEVKLIQKYLTAQRDRIDRNYIQNREWSYANFKEFYLDHGLMSFITKKLIWNLVINGEKTPTFYREGNWQTVDNQLIEAENVEKVTLWHPVEADTETVLNWRDQLATWQVKQPFKQAYREVYILTDAEVNTRVYSNRMAAHILKQHQFNALAGLRGWKYSLLGWYDDGRHDEIASINIPAYNLSAEFWIGELNEDEAFNDAGIWNYVTTDQVRFKNPVGTINLIDVPKMVFSEIMRDVDMFVGVASVGNDPQWQDNGGMRQHHDYWQAYSFGDLSELAKTRKTVLEKLIPRLKIRDKAEVDGKFLKVQGKIRNYKVHIGSTNILMEPNDQYLCIVPSRKKDTKTEGIFLPFEGDRGLSVVLSKAFMLVDDDKITDETITSQIGG